MKTAPNTTLGFRKALALLSIVVIGNVQPANAQSACVPPSDAATHGAGAIPGFAANYGNGVLWDTQAGGGAALTVTKSGSLSETTGLAFAGNPHEICAADFNKDGWPDFAASNDSGSELSVWINGSFDSVTPFNTAPPGIATNGVNNDPAPTVGTSRKARFDKIVIPNSAGSGVGGAQYIGCGDMNKDGFMDFYVIQSNTENTNGTVGRAKLYRHNGNAGNPTFTASDLTTNIQWFKGMLSDGEAKSFDMNGDGFLDIVVASSANNTGFETGCGAAADGRDCGLVRVFRNNGLNPPQFSQPSLLNGTVPLRVPLESISGNLGFSAVDLADINQDGLKDLIVGGMKAYDVRVHYGLAGNAFQTTPQIISAKTQGSNTVLWNRTGSQNIMVGDFNLDGLPDIVMATDQGRAVGSPSARWMLWKNKGAPNYVGGPLGLSRNNAGTSVPLSTNPIEPDSAKEIGFTSGDSDVGMMMDYDADGDQDFIVADGNQSVDYKVFATIATTLYADCGYMYSDPVPLGSLDSTEMIIRSAEITPTWDLNGGTIEVEASVQDPPVWKVATNCPPASTKCQVDFGRTAGRTLRWRVKMCSVANRTASPKLRAMTMQFAYEPAAMHFNAGVVAEAGVAYVGGFRMPGDRGHLFALPSVIATTYWDVGTRLDQTNVSRKVFTTAVDGVTKLPFEKAQVSDVSFQGALGLSTSTATTEVVEWWFGKRFGLNADKYRLGSVVESTPAVLAPPVRPYYYNFADLSTRSAIDSFIAQRSGRPRLVLAGSKAGALHAVNTDPVSAVCAASNFAGTEAWAFIPQKVAAGFIADKNATDASRAAANGSVVTPITTAYVDGATTLADVKINGAYRTVAVVGMGSGGKSFSALDVTDTVTNNPRDVNGCSVSQTVTGPTPLWELTPGGSTAGLAKSKPAVIRVKIAGQERFMAVLATNIDANNNATSGRVVEGIDIATGTKMWQFQTACPITSNVSGFEAGARDGFIDRVMVGDACGYLYKINPAVNDPEVWQVGLGDVFTGVLDPGAQPIKALFTTKDQASLRVASETAPQRPIFGTIGIEEPLCVGGECTGLKTLAFFGTGGEASFAKDKRNAFFKIDTEDGSVDGSVVGSCEATGLGRCEKFYGGVIVSSGRVFTTRTYDEVNNALVCDPGSASVTSFNVDTLAVNTIYQTQQASAIQSSLFAVQGALYATNLKGQIVRIGNPVLTGPAIVPPTNDPNVPAVSIKKRSWKQVY
jgi:hypothetical protein